MSRALHFILLAIAAPLSAMLLVSTLACTATETGNPSLDPSLLFMHNPASVPMPGYPPDLVIEGTPGTVTPPRGHILAWNLETRDPESVADVAGDGSFRISLSASPTQHVRLQAVSDDYSAPITIELGLASGTPRVISPCLEWITHTVWVPSEGSAVAELRNECGELRDVRAFIRGSGEAIRVETTSHFVRVEVSASDLGESSRDLLIVTAETRDGASVREAVTLVAEPR